MDRLISEQAVLNAINRYGTDELRIKAIKAIPSAEPKTGHWEWQTEDIYRCSECSEDIHVKEVMNVPQYEWCPMCGARMIEPQESEVSE